MVDPQSSIATSTADMDRNDSILNSLSLVFHLLVVSSLGNWFVPCFSSPCGLKSWQLVCANVLGQWVVVDIARHMEHVRRSSFWPVSLKVDESFRKRHVSFAG